MGAYLSQPVTEKISSDEVNEKLECGASSMQGWRVNQEVRYCFVIIYYPNGYFYCFNVTYDIPTYVFKIKHQISSVYVS